MPHKILLDALNQEKLAAKSFEKTGHHKFRDCITFCRNGRVLFERYCYGEAAGIVFSMWASSSDENSFLNWDYTSSNYSKKTEAPTRLTGISNGTLFFDDKKAEWECTKNFKFFPKGRISFFNKLF